MDSTPNIQKAPKRKPRRIQQDLIVDTEAFLSRPPSKINNPNNDLKRAYDKSFFRDQRFDHFRLLKSFRNKLEEDSVVSKCDYADEEFKLANSSWRNNRNRSQSKSPQNKLSKTQIQKGQSNTVLVKTQPPAKQKIQDTKFIQELSTQPVSVKRGRGRPPGSKNKVKVEEIQTQKDLLSLTSFNCKEKASFKCKEKTFTLLAEKPQQKSLLFNEKQVKDKVDKLKGKKAIACNKKNDESKNCYNEKLAQNTGIDDHKKVAKSEVSKKKIAKLSLNSNLHSYLIICQSPIGQFEQNLYRGWTKYYQKYIQAITMEVQKQQGKPQMANKRSRKTVVENQFKRFRRVLAQESSESQSAENPETEVVNYRGNKAKRAARLNTRKSPKSQKSSQNSD